MTTTIINKSQIVDFNEKTSNNSTSSLIGTPEVLIRSKERVKKLAEVYTAKKEVDAMLNLIPKETWDKIDSTFLEPSCGDGNFIEAIIIKKLEYLKKPKQIKKNQIQLEFDILTTISSVYGIDICAENVERCKARILNLIQSYYSNNFNTINPTIQFKKLLAEIINVNYIVGDTLNESHNIFIVQWERPVNLFFRKNYFRLSELSNPNPKPYKQEKSQKFNGK